MTENGAASGQHCTWVHIGLKMILIANFNVYMVQAGFKVIITQKQSKHTQFSIVSSVLQKKSEIQPGK